MWRVPKLVLWAEVFFAQMKVLIPKVETVQPRNTFIEYFLILFLEIISLFKGNSPQYFISFKNGITESKCYECKFNYFTDEWIIRIVDDHLGLYYEDAISYFYTIFTILSTTFISIVVTIAVAVTITNATTASDSTI